MNSGASSPTLRAPSPPPSTEEGRRRPACLHPQPAPPFRSTRRALALALAAVAFFHLAFGSAVLGFLIAGYLFCLFHLSRLATSRRAFYFGLGIGLASYAPQLGFFWTIFGGGAVALWLVLAFWLGLFLVLARQCRQRFGEVGAVLLIPFVWTGLEYFRSELYYLRFSWFSAGYVFSDHFYYVGRLGVYGVGFCLMLALGIISRLPRTTAILLGGAWVVVLAAISLEPRVPPRPASQPSHELAVAGVQMEFPAPAEVPFVLDEVIRRYPPTELLVLSEYTFDGPVPEPVKNWCRKRQRYLVVGGKDVVSATEFYDTAFVVGPTGEIIFRQAKCVPIQFFKDGLAARAQNLWDSPWGRIGICICYDLSYRRVTDELVRQGAQALIVPTMDLVDWGEHQHQLHARIAPVRAAEYGVPIFRVDSSGISQLVEGDGTVVATAPFAGERAMLAGRLTLSPPAVVPFDHFLAPFCVCLTGALIAWVGLSAVRKKPHQADSRVDDGRTCSP